MKWGASFIKHLKSCKFNELPVLQYDYLTISLLTLCVWLVFPPIKR